MTVLNSKTYQIIKEETDTRLEFMVLSTIMDNGIKELKKVTDEDICNSHGNALISDDVWHSVLKAATRIAKECNTTEIFQYIRCFMTFNPQVNELELYREDMTSNAWMEITNDLSIEYESKRIKLFGIVTEVDGEEYEN